MIELARLEPDEVARPGDEGVDPRARTAHEVGVHAEPRTERDVAVQLVVMLAHLGHRGAVADHRHDPLVLVPERGAGLARHVGEDVLRGPLPALHGDGSQLREGVALVVRDRGDVTDDEHVRIAGR